MSAESGPPEPDPSVTATSRPVTLKDVAARAGVSPATASRTLNGKHVDGQMAARVHAAVAELGYRPNAVARNLRRRDTRVWALVIADLANPFFTGLARGVEDVASANGFSLLLCNTDENVDKERRYLEVVEAERVAGLVIAPLTSATDVSRLAGMQIVAVDRPLPGFSMVGSRSREGAQVATDHLLDQGWRRVAMLGGPSDSQTAHERALGYGAALAARGQEGRIVRCSYTVEGGRSGAAELLDHGPRPDAIVAANAMLALGLLEVARERGLVIGDDLGLVMFDDATWAPLIDPPITVIRQDSYAMGAQAAQLLVDRLAGAPGEPHQVDFPTELIERLSSRRR